MCPDWCPIAKTLIMTRNFFNVLFLWIICSFLVFFCFVVAASAQGLKPRPAHVGFIYPLSTNGVEAPQQTNNFSLHAIAGVSYQENALCISGVSSLVRHQSRGLLLSGISNHVGQKAYGAQIAGVLNQVKGDAQGVQLAGVANVTGSMDGAQIAGFANVSKDAHGLQLAGFSNSARATDVQVAGFANVAKSSEAVQVAGFINIAKDANTQVAGFINIAKKVTGPQISGLINIAEESDYPVGLINIIKKGEKQIGVSIDETGNTLINFRSGGKILYGIVGAGINFNDDNARYVLEGGMGAHFPIAKYFRANFELVSSAMSDLQYDVYTKSTARLLAAFKIANRIEFFAGPTFNHLGYERGQPDIRNDRYLWKDRNDDHINGFYFGAMGGVQINL